MHNPEMEIEEEISIFKLRAEESVTQITEGSDEYLDKILTVIKPLNETSSKFEHLNDILYKKLGGLDDNIIREKILPDLKDLNRLCFTLEGAVAACCLYRDVRQAYKRFVTQHSILREIMHDLQNIRLSEDKEFEDILNDINGDF